jgi:hypothetical protein
VLGYAALGGVLGQDQFLKVDLPAVIGVVAVCNAVLAGPAVRLVSWVLAPLQADRARMAAGAGRW